MPIPPVIWGLTQKMDALFNIEYTKNILHSVYVYFWLLNLIIFFKTNLIEL